MAKDEAERLAQGQVLDAIEENLPEDADQRDWNWEALAKMANSRWRLSLRDRDLKKVGRDGVAELLIEKAAAAVQATDLAAGERFLQEDYGARTACAWVEHKFGVKLDFDRVRDMELPQFTDLVREKAREVYEKMTSLTTGRYRDGHIYAKSFYMLGKIHEQLGNTAKAIEHYEKFLDLWKDADPGITEVDDARKRMAGLAKLN